MAKGILVRSPSYLSLDKLVEMLDELASILASIKDFMVGIPPPEVSHGAPFHLSNHYETIPPPPIVHVINDVILAE
ncbi:hypothetical protein CK203_114176 [Vitis vinifera]|uniref:Uncharacterized protein n=1 Tax=Vitis vinifera TaxID=29760 RepID=A0A438CAP6_VITVI|nr:hypothetical protein CK203_114176 [Vitis vinifera]